MDNPILTPRGAGRYVIATDVADLKLGITDGDPFVFTEGPSDNYDKPTLESLMMRDSATYQSEWHEAHGKFGPNGSQGEDE